MAAHTHTEPERKHSARVLAGLVTLQGVVALGGLLWLVGVEGRSLTHGITLYFALVAALSFVTAALEWSRMRYAEMFAIFALMLSFGLTLAAMLAGFWYLVPFVGLATIAAIFGLVDRFAMRDETRHQPAHP